MEPKEESRQAVERKKPWRPAQAFHLANKQPGYRYRFVHDDPDSIDRKCDEGWIFVNPTTHGRKAASNASVSKMTTSRRYRSLVLMALPEDIAEGRDEYFKKLTDAQTMKPAQRMRQQLDESGNPAVMYDPTRPGQKRAVSGDEMMGLIRKIADSGNPKAAAEEFLRDRDKPRAYEGLGPNARYPSKPKRPSITRG